MIFENPVVFDMEDLCLFVRFCRSLFSCMYFHVSFDFESPVCVVDVLSRFVYKYITLHHSGDVFCFLRLLISLNYLHSCKYIYIYICVRRLKNKLSQQDPNKKICTIM